MDNTPSGLLSDVKSYIGITWQDAVTDKDVTGIIARGMKYLDRKAGVSLDYTIEDSPRSLLFEYCKYARSNLLHEFMKDYLHELIHLQLSYKE